MITSTSRARTSTLRFDMVMAMGWAGVCALTPSSFFRFAARARFWAHRITRSDLLKFPLLRLDDW